MSWFTCHEFLNEILAQRNYGPLPAAGTPDWQALGDSDPRKLLALAEAGVHQALRVDTEQMLLAEASREMSAVDDWTAVATRIQRGRGPAYVPRRKESV